MLVVAVVPRFSACQPSGNVSSW